jgi:LmbE family N-acetylglucosaminyl deacetylase
MGAELAASAGAAQRCGYLADHVAAAVVGTRSVSRCLVRAIRHTGEVSATTVFFHAHPDDEAIFTGGTIAKLAAAGHRVVIAVATGGELGGLHHPGADRDGLAFLRRAETERAAGLLGAAEVQYLDYLDSGMPGDPANEAPGSLWSADVAEVAARLAAILDDVKADHLVVYDEFGVYGHPDHIAVHRAGILAAAETGIVTLYESTVDREYLHFVETHLVEEAILATDLGLARSHLGVPSVLVTTTVDVHDVLDAKRAAMAAHASQIPETTSALQLGLDHFADVYGYEWYVRHGPRGAIDEIAE